jgi:hypothetical protein
MPFTVLYLIEDTIIADPAAAEAQYSHCALGYRLERRVHPAGGLP